jgi:flagellar motor protein MotB
VAATGATSGGTRTAHARTRAIQAVEHFITPPGAWLPNQTALSTRGRRFLRSRRARLIAVAAVRCDGYSAKVRAHAPNATRISLARAAAVCTALHRRGVNPTPTVIGHGDSRPIASNTTAAGRARNRRVEVTITHRHTPL